MGREFLHFSQIEEIPDPYQPIYCFNKELIGYLSSLIHYRIPLYFLHFTYSLIKITYSPRHSCFLQETWYHDGSEFPMMERLIDQTESYRIGYQIECIEENSLDNLLDRLLQSDPILFFQCEEGRVEIISI